VPGTARKVPPSQYLTPAASSMPCNATFIKHGLITPPYEQCRVMRSAGLMGLVEAGSASEHCA
jgi:hypothetical protein